ncbi:MAG: CHRD domain-containing protein [Planctomycetota bacterium]
MRIRSFSLAAILSLVLGLSWWSPADADVITFVVTGAAGEGLLEGNIDPPTGELGTGGVGSTGLIYDTNTNLLHVDLVWGSGNGFIDLSQDVDRLHLHGPTDGSGVDAFGQTAPLAITLSNSSTFDASRTNGGVNDNFFISQGDEQALLDGRFYINVHLSDTDTGIIRGYMIAVPEPAGGFCLLLSIAGFACQRRRACRCV